MRLSVRVAAAALLSTALSACDIPTGLPQWETTWVTPSEGTSVSVVELLPAGLDVNADTSAFVLSIDTASGGFMLSDFCPSCPPATFPVPKPAFRDSVEVDVPLPSAVRSATIAGGELIVRLRNDFDFDPIRPSASARGSVRVQIRSGTTLVGSLVIDGNQRAFPANSTLMDTLQFLPSTIADTLTMRVILDSPAGDPTTMQPSDGFTASVWSDGLEVSQATVNVAAQTISGVESEIDLSGVDVEDITEGTIFMEIQNPFSITGNLTVSVDPEGSAGPFNKMVQLAPGDTEVSITFDENEIQQMIGEVNTLTVGGTVNAVGGAVTVRPDMVIGIDTRLRVTVLVGGSDDESSN